MWYYRKCKVAPVVHSQRKKKTFSARNSPGLRGSPLGSAMPEKEETNSTSLEIILGESQSSTEEFPASQFLQRLKKVFRIGGKSRSRRKWSKKNVHLFERLKRSFRNDRKPKIEDASTLHNTGLLESGLEEPQEISRASHSRPLHLPPLHPPGESRPPFCSSEHPDANLRLSTSSFLGQGSLVSRKEFGIKAQIDAGFQKMSYRRASRHGKMDYGRVDIMPAINATATQLPEMFTPEEQFMKDYSEGIFPAENPFKNKPDFVYLAPPQPPNEADRLAKLATYCLQMDDGDSFKRIVTLAECIFQTKMVLISVIEKNDLWVKAHVGFDKPRAPRDTSFCAHAILKKDTEPFVVPDTAQDWRFARHPAVVNEPFVRFYAGVPLRTTDGYNLGTLCIADTVPRELTPEDCHILRELGALATREFDLLLQISGSRDCHVNEMFVSQFVQQAPFYKSVQDICEYFCRLISKALKTDINFVLEVTSLSEKKFLVRAIQGLGDLPKHGRSYAFVESQDINSWTVRREPDAFGDLKEVVMGSNHQRVRSLSEKKPRGSGLLGSDLVRETRRTSFSRHESIRTIRLLEEIKDSRTEAPSERDESFTHRQLSELLFPQTRGFCCCSVPHEIANGRLGTASLFDFQKFCLVGGAEKFLFDDEGEVLNLSSTIQDSATMYIIGAYCKEPTVPFSDCQVTCLLSFATALSSAVSHHKTEVALRKSEADVRKEKELLTALVNNILPPVYAERLKADQCAVADRFSNCSIIFADIVGFTSIGGSMAADELVGMLNKIFIRFDMIAEELGVEKIKTIGDCYMAATGVPVEQEFHADIMAEFALALLVAVTSFNKTSDIPILIRVGMNSGPVVAGAIGHSKFVYDLWGNAVNIAQRMEAGSEADRINVSQDTYHLLRNKYRFTSRGRYPVKGAGLMEMYYLEGRLDETRDEEGLLPEEALVQYIEATMTNHNVLGRLNALSQVGQYSSTGKSGCLGLAALVGSLCELGGGVNNRAA